MALERAADLLSAIIYQARILANLFDILFAKQGEFKISVSKVRSCNDGNL
jgi:hypothetical protein